MPPADDGSSAAASARPPITEIKPKLDGGEKRFACTVLSRVGGHLIVLFIAPVAMHVHGVDLPAGTVTLGHFWTERPYNVYHWLDATSGATIGFYVNLSDGTVFADDHFAWRDLTVDILIAPDGTAVVLDEDEVPADLPAPLLGRINDSKAAVLAHRAALLAELEGHRRALWPSLHAAPAKLGGGP